MNFQIEYKNRLTADDFAAIRTIADRIAVIENEAELEAAYRQIEFLSETCYKHEVGRVTNYIWIGRKSDGARIAIILPDSQTDEA